MKQTKSMPLTRIQLDALERLSRQQDWHFVGQYSQSMIRPNTLRALVRRKLVERNEENRNLYRVTELGRKRLQTPSVFEEN